MRTVGKNLCPTLSTHVSGCRHELLVALAELNITVLLGDAAASNKKAMRLALKIGHEIAGSRQL